LRPDELLARASVRNVIALALTDHDETGGLAMARSAAADRGIKLINGVEISVTWRNQTLHILGLGIDPANSQLRSGLSATRAGRTQRAHNIAAVLEGLGITGSFEGAKRFAGNPEIVGRTHFARYLVEQGVVKDMPSAFKRFLGNGRPGHVPHQWAALSDAVDWILDSGGVPVIAHPGRYSLDASTLGELLAEFRDYGGGAIEVVSGSHSPQQYATFAQLACQFGFAASAGSDFHSPLESRQDLGNLPALPAGCTPVWEKFDLFKSASLDNAMVN
jgi:predicted metal-dependent phosphoesterase TrpH